MPASTSTWAALKQEQADLVAASRELLDRVRSEGREFLTREEQAADDARMLRLREVRTALEIEEVRREAARSSSAMEDIARSRGIATGPRWASMFPDLAGETRGFASASEFFGQIHSGLYSPQLHAMMNGGTGSAGGFMIPEQFAGEMMDGALESEIVRPRARIEPMTSDTKKIAGITHRDGSSGPYGGVGGWVGEGQTIGEDIPPLQVIELHAHAVKALTQLSNEVISDAGDLAGQLTEALQKAGAWIMDYAFLRGTGSGQPLGILNAPCTITVSKETGQGSDSVIYENVAAMLARLHPASMTRAVWVANPTLIPQLLTLSYSLGTAGEPVPVLRESDGAWQMLTRPVIFSEKASALGDVGDLMLCDFRNYAVGIRADIRIESSGHAGFTTDSSYYRLVVRCDGQPLWDAPYTPKHGDTQSPFIVLEAR